MDHPPLTAEAYFHVRAGISIIFGLSLTHLLRGVVRMVQHPELKPVYPVHVAWVASSFLLVVHFWWWEINVATIAHWTFPPYLFLISYSCLFYFLCVLLFPDHPGPHQDYRTYFHAERRWIFGVLALISAAGVVDSLLKGSSHLATLGVEYQISTLIYLGLCVGAMFTANETYHSLFVGLNLVYQLSWMFRMYDF